MRMRNARLRSAICLCALLVWGTQATAQSGGSFMFGGTESGSTPSRPKTPPVEQVAPPVKRPPPAEASRSEKISDAETIKFLERYFANAASLTKAKYFARPDSRRATTETFSVRLYVRQDKGRFHLFFRDTRAGPVASYYVWFSDGSIEPMRTTLQESGYESSSFNFDYFVRLEDVVLGYGNSTTYVEDDDSTYMQGIKFTCKVGSCVSGHLPRVQDRRFLTFPISDAVIMQRLFNAFAHLKSRTPVTREPF